MEWCKILKKSFIFSIDIKRWLPFFGLNSLFLILGLLILTNFIGTKQLSSSFSSILDILVLGVIFVTVYPLLNLWINGAIVYQSYKERDKIGKSFRQSYNRYLSLLGATIIVGIINVFVSIIPYIGFIFSILISLIFFFIYQGVIVKGLGFDETLVHSYKLFRKNWATIVGIYIVLALIVILILGVFSIPLISLLVSLFFSLKTYSLISIMSLIYSNLIYLVITGIITLIGFAISQVFYLKAQTEFYLRLKRKS